MPYSVSSNLTGRTSATGSLLGGPRAAASLDRVSSVEIRPFEDADADGIARLVSYGLRSGLEAQDAVKALSGISCHQGPRTCLNEVASAIRIVLKHLETGADLNSMIEEEEFATANATEVAFP